MRTLKALLPTSLVLSALGIAGCGGGGGDGFSIAGQDLQVLQTVITEPPQGGDVNALYESADPVDWEIPLAGGCGGPYVINVIGGSLPAGVSAVGGIGTSGNHHHLRGTVLEDGAFAFRLQITDTNCTPFATTEANFTWTVAEGNV